MIATNPIFKEKDEGKPNGNRFLLLLEKELSGKKIDRAPTRRPPSPALVPAEVGKFLRLGHFLYAHIQGLDRTEPSSSILGHGRGN